MDLLEEFEKKKTFGTYYLGLFDTNYIIFRNVEFIIILIFLKKKQSDKIFGNI